MRVKTMGNQGDAAEILVIVNIPESLTMLQRCAWLACAVRRSALGDSLIAVLLNLNVDRHFL